jgi:hypothetical protein
VSDATLNMGLAIFGAAAVFAIGFQLLAGLMFDVLRTVRRSFFG